MGAPLDRVPVFYSERLLADAQSFSPSAGKPRDVVQAWQRAGLPVQFLDVTASSDAEIALAHDPAYVSDVLSGDLPNGFGNHSASVARSLPYTTGAMVDAALAALTRGCACAPVSGFHHARYAVGGGFCTFNGLVVAARRALETDAVERVLILDCDMHFGDGTDQILQQLELTDVIENFTLGRWFDGPADAPRYLARLRKIADSFADYDLILYQAGADVHIDDPLGGVLTTAQMLERDRLVFSAARASAVPIAWNLAGGYQDPLVKVTELHVQTLRECARVYCGTAIRASDTTRSAS